VIAPIGAPHLARIAADVIEQSRECSASERILGLRALAGWTRRYKSKSVTHH
jgi:hypothetical protein